MKYREIVFLMIGMTAVAGAGRADDETSKAQGAFKRRTSLEALIKGLDDPSFYQPERGSLARMILGKIEAHHAPAPGLIRAELRAGFDARFNRSVHAEAELRDPAGKKYDLERWLKNRCDEPQKGRSASIRQWAAQAHERYLTGPGFATDYEAARREVADDQVAQTRRNLDPETSFPTAKEIEAVHRREIDGELQGTKTRESLVEGLIRNLRAGRPLLQEAQAQVADLASSMVASGLEQLQAQLHVLDEPPGARTPAGMTAEFEKRQDAYVASFKPVPARKAYGVFPLARTKAAERALQLWDSQIAHAADRIKDDLHQGQRRLSPSHEQGVRKEIADHPEKHHHPRDSIEAMTPILDGVINEAQGWVYDILTSAVKSAPPGLDSPVDVDRIPRLVQERLKEQATPAGPAWKGLAEEVRWSFKKRIEHARDEIAQEQAKSGLPQIAAGTWTPEEKLFQSVEPRAMNRAVLKGLPVWGAKPAPVPETLWLDETWERLLTSAREAIELGRDAHEEQLAIPTQIESRMATQIGKAPEKGADFWIGAYKQEVAGIWQGTGKPASRYPGLFKATEDRISGLVANLLNFAAKDAQHSLVERLFPDVETAIAKAIQAEAAGAQPTELEVFYEQLRPIVEAAWAKNELAAQHPALFDDTESLMRGKIQKCMDAQVDTLAKSLIGEAGKDIRNFKDPPGDIGKFLTPLRTLSQRRPLRPERQAELDKLVLLALILQQQNILVGQFQSWIKTEMEKSAGDAIGQDRKAFWKTKYAERVDKAWMETDLGKKNPGLLEPVHQRIAGIVDTLLAALATQSPASLVGKIGPSPAGLETEGGVRPGSTGPGESEMRTDPALGA